MVEGGLNRAGSGFFHSLSNRNWGTPSCKNSIGSDARVASPWITWNSTVLVQSATHDASTQCKSTSATSE